MVNRDYTYERNADTQRTPTYRKVVHAMFPDPDFAGRALGALLDMGVQADDVSVMVKDMPAGWVGGKSGTDILDQATSGITVTTPQDAGSGAMKGAGVGLGIGALAALASLVIPGIGVVIGGGALATAIGGAVATGAAGAMAGAVVGYLKDQGIDENLAVAVQADYDQGGALVSVSAPSGEVSEEEVEQTLAKYQDQGYVFQADQVSKRYAETHTIGA